MDGVVRSSQGRVTISRPGEPLYRVDVFRYGIEFQDAGRIEGSFEIFDREDGRAMNWVSDAFKSRDRLVIESSSDYAGSIRGECIISEMSVNIDARYSPRVEFKIVGTLDPKRRQSP